MFVILCRSYGARADFGFGSYKDVAPTELDLTSAFSNRLLMSACAERPDIMHQIPNVVVRFDFSERGHPAESDAILHDPEEFTIGICLYITRCKVRCARVHHPGRRRETNHLWERLSSFLGHRSPPGSLPDCRSASFRNCWCSGKRTLSTRGRTALSLRDHLRCVAGDQPVAQKERGEPTHPRPGSEKSSQYSVCIYIV
jgi:hypothetical protein